MTQIDHALQSIAPNGDTMSTIDLTFQEFLKGFGNDEGKALYYIDNILAEGRIEVSENTLPYYTFVNGRFIAYGDHQPQTHSFSMRIQRWYEDDDSSADAIITFDRSDNGWAWFFSNLYSTLDGVTDQSEMHWEDNIETHHRRERDALALQMVINDRRLARTRIYLIQKGATITPNEFEQHCVRVAKMREENDRALKRIEELGY